MSKIRDAFTIIEMMIVLLVFSVVMVMVVQAITASRDVEGIFVAQDELTEDMGKMMKVFASDFAQSGWHVPATQANATSPPVVTPMPVLSYVLNAVTGVLEPDEAGSFVGDRDARYWPKIISQQSGFRSTAHPYLDRTASFQLDNSKLPLWRDAPSFTDAKDRHMRSLFDRSREIVFLQQVTTQWQASPDVMSEPRLSFPGTFDEWRTYDAPTRAKIKVLYPSGWKNVSTDPTIKDYKTRTDWDVDGDKILNLTGGERPYGRTMVSAMVDAQTGGSGFKFLTTWQTINRGPLAGGPNYVTPRIGNTASISNQDTWLRDFTYAIVPSPIGFGRLVRAYRADKTVETSLMPGVEVGNYISNYGDSVMKIESVLSDNVTRVVFDTCRTDHALLLNQIRARVYLARKSAVKPEVIVTQVLDQVFAMRARNSQADRTNDRKVYFGDVMGAGLPSYPY